MAAHRDYPILIHFDAENDESEIAFVAFVFAGLAHLLDAAADSVPGITIYPVIAEIPSHFEDDPDEDIDPDLPGEDFVL